VRYARAVLSMVLERLSGAAGRGAGGFLGGLLNNPAVVILGALAVVFVFFGSDIRKAFASFGENIGKVELPAVTLPTINFPDIKFPDFDFKFPDFDFKFPEFDFKFPEFDFKFPDFFNQQDQLPSDVEIFGQELTPEQQEEIRRRAEILEMGGGAAGVAQEFPVISDPTKFLPPDRATVEELFPDQPVNLTDFVNRFAGRERDLSIPAAPSIAESIIAPFQGGGVSFEGGQIFETPIERLSLGQIIDQGLAGSASEAASLRAEAIGFSDEETAFLEQGQEISPLGDIASAPQVSDPMFEGLSAQEIALRLTGGNISNF